MAGMMLEWMDFQGELGFDILQQARFLLDGFLLARFNDFGLLHHLGRFVADVAAIHHAIVGSPTIFGLLEFV